MKQYASWQAPFYSFWSKSFYIDVAKNWHGLAYSYIFAIICFTWIFMAAKKQIEINSIAEHDIYPFIEKMPKITIEKGILSIDRSSPFTMSNGAGIPVITFDTREKPMALEEIPSSFLVTKDSVCYKSAVTLGESSASAKYSKDQAKDQKLDLSTIDHQIIDQNAARQFVSDFCKSIGLIIFMIAVPLAFIFCLIQTLIYALLGLLIAKINKVDLSYGTLIRLSVVALTPVLLIDSIIKVRGLDLNLWPIWPLVAFIIGITYVIFAVSVNIVKQDNKPELSNL